MTTLNKLALALNIRPAENRLVTLFLLHSFFAGMAQVLVSTTASTLFLNSFQKQSAQYLPWVYIGTAIVASLAGILYTKLEKPLSFTRLLTANLSLLIAALLGFRLVFALIPQARSAAMLLYIWYYVQDALINLEFWGLAARIFDVRQGKRLFGLIGAGEMLARIIGGFSVRPLVKITLPENLLMVAAAAIALCLLFMTLIMRAYQNSNQESQPARAPKSKANSGQTRRSFSQLFQSQYIQLMAALTVIALLGYYFVDIAFLDQTQAQFPNKSDLAGFMGNFFAVIGILAFLSRLFLSGPLISRYGLAAGLLALPLAGTLGAGSIALGSAIFGAEANLFLPAAFTKLNFIVFRKSTDKSAFPVLYQPLPKNERVTVQTVMDSIVAPVASGLAGILLLLLSFNIVQIAYALLLIFGVWMIIIFFLNREYKNALLNAITKRKLEGVNLNLTDSASLNALTKSLKSRRPGEVLYALDVMEATEHPDLEKSLKKLLRHPAEQVRLNTLQRIERLKMTGALKRIQSRLRLEKSPRVLGAAVRCYAALGESDVLHETLPYLDNPQPQVRLGAMVGILRSGGVEGVLAAGERFLALQNSNAPADRAFAAEVLGEVGIHNFYRPLISLLQDPSPSVRRKALRAAENLRLPPPLRPLTLQNLSDYRVRTAAASALLAGGKEIVPLLAQAFEAPNQSPRVLIQLARIAGRIKGKDAVALLKKHLAHPNKSVRAQVLASLSQRRYQANEAETSFIQQRIRAEIADAAHTLAALRDLETASAPSAEAKQALTLLQNALLSNQRACKNRVLLLLSLLYDPEAILQAKYILEHTGASGAKNSAYALEVIDVFIAQELKPIVFPLLEPLPPAAQLKRLADAFPQPQLSVAARLAQIIGATGRGEGQRTKDEGQNWLKACALYFAEFLPQQSLPQTTGDKTMLSTFEKVLILKSVDIFSETPEDALAEVAAILDDVELKPGDTLFNKGDVGNAMFIIVTGKIHIYDGERSLAKLGERDIFGELTLLDAEPRSAAAAALEPTRLFKLHQETFYELMADYPQIARGIIKALSRRLRAQNKLLAGGEAQPQNRKRPLSKDLEGIFDSLEGENSPQINTDRYR